MHLKWIGNFSGATQIQIDNTEFKKLFYPK